MLPKTYLQKLSAAVSERSGIARATVEQVLPALFDEIRYQLCECKHACVPIESFGTFAVIDIPERQHHYTYKGADEMRTLPATQRLKFASTKNFRRELEAHQFDPTRKSFQRHPQDPPIRKRTKLLYQPKKMPVFKGQTQYSKEENEPDKRTVESREAPIIYDHK